MPKARHPVILSLVAIILLLVCANFGPGVLFLVGVPGFFILIGVAGGAKMPSKIPARHNSLRGYFSRMSGDYRVSCSVRGSYESRHF
jgi:hypothetical protein